MADKETMAIIKQMVADGQISQEVAEKYFPELKPKDERIINALIRLLRQCAHDGYDNVVEGVGIPEAIAWLEKQGEQKTNPEPKFEEGDIVKHSYYDGLYYKVKSVDLAGDYELECINGEKDDNIAAATEKRLSLWTIQDAKAGDVLADENSIVIFRKIGNERWSDVIDYYAVLYKTDDFTIQRGISYWGTTEKTDLSPATKEQRDLLFQKMKEAGYEWDAEKKELRKIEQKPVDKVEQKGMNIVEEDMTPFQKKVFCIIDTTIEEEQGLKQVCDELLRLAHDEIMQKPAEWSDEDESIYNAILDTVNKDLGLIVVHRDWFKNIKYRLKSLRPQNQWKPTEKEMEAISIAVHDSHNRSYHTELYRLKLDLKKLTE